MPFPDAPRVIYKKNPLDRVICQLRFPPILRIEKDTPVEFQEHIRDEFPEFKVKHELVLPLSLKKHKENSAEVPQQIVPTETINYEFSSEDNCWTVNLTRTFLALTTKKYTRRSDFNEHLKGPLTALLDIYKPAYFSRLGLRYVDIIRRSLLNLKKEPWNKLLKPHILGFLGSSDVYKNIQSFDAKCEILLKDRSSIARIVTGLVEWKENNNEQCFLIDSDFYNTNKITPPTEKKVMKKLEYFQVRASRLIQWLITKKLHKAMEPEKV